MKVKVVLDKITTARARVVTASKVSFWGACDDGSSADSLRAGERLLKKYSTKMVESRIVFVPSPTHPPTHRSYKFRRQFVFRGNQVQTAFAHLPGVACSTKGLPPPPPTPA